MTLYGNWWTAPLKEEVSNKDILRIIFTYSRRLFETFLLKHTQAFAIYRLFGKAGRKIRLGSIIRTQHTSLHKHNTCKCVYKNTINVCIYMYVWYIYTCRGNFKKMKCIRIFFLQRINLKIEQYQCKYCCILYRYILIQFHIFHEHTSFIHTCIWYVCLYVCVCVCGVHKTFY